MKQGLLIFDNEVYNISFEQNPTLKLETIENKDGTKFITEGKHIWLPMVIESKEIDDKLTLLNVRRLQKDTCFIYGENRELFRLNMVNFDNTQIFFGNCKLLTNN